MFETYIMAAGRATSVDRRPLSLSPLDPLPSPPGPAGGEHQVLPHES